MQSERLRGDVKKEAEARERECEDMRSAYQRRVRRLIFDLWRG